MRNAGLFVGATHMNSMPQEQGFPRSRRDPPLRGEPRQLPQKQSLVAQTLAVLREEIASGAWARGLPGERRLCEQFVISRGTLRAALASLKREGLVQGSHGRRWQVVGPRWRKLRASATRNLVLLTPQPLHVLTQFAIFWIDDLRTHLGEAGYHLEVCHEHTCYVSQPDRPLEALAQRERPAGWVLCGTTAQMQQWFSKHGMPCVIIGSRHEGVALPSVDRDLPAACRHAVGLFFAKGHFRLVLLNPKTGLAGDLECEKSFCEAAAKLQPGTSEALIAHHDGTPQCICARLTALLQRRPAPTGFLVSGSKYTLTTLGFLLSRGLRLPREAALIGRDNDAFVEYVLPTVARYSTDPRLFARKVSRTVLRLVRGDAVLAQDYRVMPHFLPGQTLGR
jgi:DNA-binding LacI/PurR family transcriptional regulator